MKTLRQTVRANRQFHRLVKPVILPFRLLSVVLAMQLAISQPVAMLALLFTMVTPALVGSAQAQEAPLAGDPPPSLPEPPPAPELPALWGNQGQYAPGAQAEFTGIGFQTNEVVTLQVTRFDEAGVTGAAHEAWVVVTDERGMLSATWTVCVDDCVGATLKVSAVGQTSAREASYVFLDEPANGSAKSAVDPGDEKQQIVPPINNATLWSWGAGESYQIGNGNYYSQAPSPIAVTAPAAWSGNRPVSVAAAGSIYTYSFYSSCAYYCGPNGQYCCSGIVYYSYFYGHSLVAMSDGTVWGWGDSRNGQLGIGSSSIVGTPVQMNANWGAGRKAVGVAAGYQHSMILLDNGALWGTGWGVNGELGTGATTVYYSPVPVAAPAAWAGKKVVSVATGPYHTLAALDDGTAWAWGFNAYGAVGDGTATQRLAPAQVVSPAWSGKKVVGLAGGGYHSAAVLDDGSVWAWGNNSNGQLGNGTSGNYYMTPNPVTAPSAWTGKKAVAVACGSDHTVVGLDDGTAWSWGQNGNGQLGDNTSTQRPTPVQVAAPPAWSGKKVTSLTSTFLHTLVALDDGSAWGWGFNYRGEMGNGTALGNTSSPVQVIAPAAWSGKKVMALATGDYHTLAVVGTPNLPPVADNDSYTVTEDNPLSIAAPGVLANDSDPDSDILTVTSVTAPAHGTLTMLPDGSFTYTPAANYNGPDSFTYTISDIVAGAATATANITVTPVNDPPVAVADHLTVGEDGWLNVADVLLNDTDPDGDTLSVLEVTASSHGNFGDAGGGIWAYFPAPNFFGDDSFRYIVGDGHGGTATNFAYITVTPVNDAPVAVDNFYNLGEDMILSPITPAVGILANDSDADGDTLTAILVNGPAHGTLTLQPDGRFTYTPTANFNGPDTFTYKVSDGTAESGVATVTINVIPVNDVPGANAQSVATAEDTALAVTLSAVDVDADTLTYSVVSAPTHGTLTGTAPNLAYTPWPNFNGADSFTFTANDGTVNSAVTTVDITVTPVNDVPVVVDASLTTPEDTALPVPVSAADVEGVGYQVLQVFGSSAVAGRSPSGGLIEGPDGLLYGTTEFGGAGDNGTVFRAAHDGSGYTVLHSFAASGAEGVWPRSRLVAGPGGVLYGTTAARGNGNGGTAWKMNADGTGFAVLQHFNFSAARIPSGLLLASDGMLYGTTVFGGSANAGTIYKVSATGTGYSVLHSLSGLANGGARPYAQLVEGPDGVLYGTTEAGGADAANGGTVFKIQKDGTGFTVLHAFAGGTADGGTLRRGLLLGSDGALYGVTTSGGPNNRGTVFKVQHDGSGFQLLHWFAANGSEGGTPQATLVEDTDGVLLGVTQLNGVAFGGTVFRLNRDGTGLGVLHHFKTGAADGQNSQSELAVGSDGWLYGVTTAGTATGAGELFKLARAASGLSYTVVSNPTHGALSGTAPNLTYTPTANYSGPDSFTFKANDGTVDSAVAAVSLTVTPVNDAPVANAQSVTTAEDTPLPIVMTGSDADGNTLSLGVTSGPAHGSVNLNSPNLTYTPAANFHGTDTITFVAFDGTVFSPPATITITVTPVNDAPVAVNDNYNLGEDMILSPITPAVGILANDSDVDGDTLTAALVSGPSHGTLTLQPDGRFTYTPTANFNGPDTFTYKVSDGTAESGVATVTINVIPVNDVPVANAQSVTTAEDTPLPIVMTGSDADGNTLSLGVTSGPAHGSVNLNSPNLTYTPAANFHGTDTITFVAFDGTVFSPPATITITVTPVNDAPVAVDNSYNLGEDMILSPITPAVGILANDSDVDGDTLSAILVSGPAHGTLTLQPDGRFTYTPTANFNGPDTFTYKVSDGTAESGVATVTINVIPVNDVPAANSQSMTTAEDTAVNITLTASDVDGDTLTYSVMSDPAHGSLSGTAPNPTYTPAANYNGPDSFTFKVNDGTVDSVLATVSITVTPVNDPPVANGQSVSTPEDSSVAILLTGLDVDGDALSYTVVSAPTHGTLSGTAPNVTYAPAANYNGPDSFTFKVNDGPVDSVPATVAITVTPVNDRPYAKPLVIYLAEDTSVAVTLSATDVLGNVLGETDLDGDAVTFTLLSSPVHGIFTGTPPNLVYTPAPNFHGTDYPSYYVSDGIVNSSPALIELVVTPVNDPPVAVADTVTVDEDSGPNLIPVLANDSIAPDTGETLAVVGVTQGAHGTVQIISGGAAVAYTPAPDYFGPDAFTYSISDGNGGMATAPVNVTVNNVLMVLTSITPTSATANGSDFTLTVNGSGFEPDTVVYWNGSAWPTTYVIPTQVTAAIPSSDLAGVTDIQTVLIRVGEPAGPESATAAFAIVPASVGEVQTSVVEAGGTATTSTPPSSATEPGVTATVQNSGGDPLTVVTATYDTKPTGETVFKVDGGSFVDLQVTGADSADVATVQFYYPASITGGAENKVKLRYFDGVNWIPVLGSGGVTPVKNTTDNLDGTLSGGRFTVVFDNTSTPKLTELNGTILAMVDPTPQILTVTGPIDPRPLGIGAGVTVQYATPDPSQTCQVTFAWDDGTTSTVNGNTGSATAAHVFATAGVYTVQVTVQDADGVSASSRFEYIVIYDPSAGFVTGGGWINSPAGAYLADPALTGKATFGFVSKYKKGATVPDGETEFELHCADFHFHSTVYEWLVISGAKAQYKGSGQINGAGNYGFLLTARDGQVTNGGGVDRFRIKIWDKSSDVVVYDNRRGVSDDMDLADPQAIGGGSIVIQKAK